MDRARQADIAGERKQIRRVNKVNRSRKIVKHTLNVTNISKDINEQALFELFESGLSTEDSKAVYKTIIVRDVSTGESRGYGRVIFRNAKATLAALNNHQWEIGGRHLYLERVQTENQNDSSEDEVHAGLYDFLPSPKKPKLSSFRLPKIMEEKILQVVGMHANGCPIGDIPTLVEGLDFAKYGFASLTQALRSIDGIKVDKKHLVHL
jgi:RNA recognition motif-containing protein